MTDKQFLYTFWKKAPLSWAIIRAVECSLLSKLQYKAPILEVGCGDGLVSSTLFSGKKYAIDVGIDLNPREITLARQTQIYKKLLCADICHTPFPDKSFSTIFANGVLEHIPDLDKALTEISRILKPGGSLVTTSPSANFTKQLFYFRLFSHLKLNTIASWYGEKLNSIFVHRHLLSENEWRSKLSKAGLKTIKCIPYNSPEIIAIHDLTLPFSLGSKQWKLLTGSLVILPDVRMYFIKLLMPFISIVINLKSSSTAFGSILVQAMKK